MENGHSRAGAALTRAPSDTLQTTGCASILGAPLGSRAGPRSVRGCRPQAGAPALARIWTQMLAPQDMSRGCRREC